MNTITQPLPGRSSSVLVVDERLLARVLEPYKQHCRYLQAATVECGLNYGPLLSAKGQFSIPESCYIADTGHFNAVEFNMCYNQLTYCLLAAAIDHKLLDALASWDIARFSRRQLSDFLIVQFFSSFRTPLKASGFEGKVEIRKVIIRQSTIFMKTCCSFDDGQGGMSKGDATIAIIGGQT